MNTRLLYSITLSSPPAGDLRRRITDMPIYEYRCNSCGRRVQLFFRSFSAIAEPRCPQCQSTDLGRLVSRVAVVRSEDSRLDDLADPSSFDNVDYEDPRSVAEWAKRMRSEEHTSEL